MRMRYTNGFASGMHVVAGSLSFVDDPEVVDKALVHFGNDAFPSGQRAQDDICNGLHVVDVGKVANLLGKPLHVI